MAIINNLPHKEKDTLGTVRESSKRISYTASTQYGSTIDTETNTTKVVFVTGAQSGDGVTGWGEASDNNSTWVTITSGFYNYRYYRSVAKSNQNNSSISYGYIGIIDLGYIKE